MSRNISKLFFLLIFLSACGPASVAPSPLPATDTLPPASPTWTLVQPTETPSVTATPEPLSPTVAEATPTPETNVTGTPFLLPLLVSPTPPKATAIPQPAADSALIQIQAPGPLSKVSSPLHLRAYIVPGYGSKARIELYGEDGRLLVREIDILYTDFKWAYFVKDIPFEVHAAGELGRLSISTEDAYGRTTAQYSVHLLLLAEGDSLVNPPDKIEERCIIEQPTSRTQISGGTVKVSGEMRPVNNLPLVVELIGRDGASLSSRLVSVPPAPDDSYVPFSIDVPYTLTKAAWALLVVRQADERISGGMYLYSQEFYLRP